MERRLHPRVELPIEVEFSHPSVGTIRTTASDISEGGVFVEIESPSVTLGAKVKITVLGLPLVASTPTPTLGMEVVRVAEDG
ncbi:MAG: PilZ domain-containing protein, partial [Gammaproteobacteria bacterium]|nr:PilZ domain-containing protein [Gammaproteobacteria bacterium]